jgi:hypothetical protein
VPCPVLGPKRKRPPMVMISSPFKAVSRASGVSDSACSMAAWMASNANRCRPPRSLPTPLAGLVKRSKFPFGEQLALQFVQIVLWRGHPRQTLIS